MKANQFTTTSNSRLPRPPHGDGIACVAVQHGHVKGQRSELNGAAIQRVQVETPLHRQPAAGRADDPATAHREADRCLDAWTEHLDVAARRAGSTAGIAARRLSKSVVAAYQPRFTLLDDDRAGPARRASGSRAAQPRSPPSPNQICAGIRLWRLWTDRL